ncbi:uncharacterized protein LOC121452483 [Microtus oregoni]|uniref:uncharacterized protein LOC121452483 n=1 Tax=Microtus oregoni TaxID=111838 RepID=UPI001BB29FB8|nr:uncharacterized protein LOC121452483 [Microtus oregoni]
MFPSAVTALTGAGRSRSPERAGRERACLGKREADERASGKEGAERPVARGRSRAARPRVRRGRREPGAGEAVASLTGPAESAGPGRATPERLCGVRPKRAAGMARRDRGEQGAHALEGAGAGSGTGAELHPEACNSWRVRGGVRASERARKLGCRVPGAGRSRAQPEWDRARLLGARVARDWLGGRGAGTREARTQPSRRAPDRSNPPPSLQPRRCGPLAGERLCAWCGRTVGSASWKARVNLEVAAGAAWAADGGCWDKCLPWAEAADPGPPEL